jgi:hypothetical protein
MTDVVAGWRRCSACKKPIDFGVQYWTCNVSTCNRKRTALQFCTVSCWEVHLPVARHREAWAEEQIAPTREAAARQAQASARKPAASRSEAPRKPRRIIQGDAKPPSAATSAGAASSPARQADVPREVLIIASRLKDYIRNVSGYNTSDRVLEPLSEIVREVCDRAIRSAEADERMTVLDRDIPRR